MYKDYSCTPDRNCHTFCLGDKIASHPGVLTQANNISPLLEINQILGVVVQEKESNMVFCSRWKFPTLGMTVLSGTEAQHGHPLGWKLPSRTEPHIRFLNALKSIYYEILNRFEYIFNDRYNTGKPEKINGLSLSACIYKIDVL